MARQTPTWVYVMTCQGHAKIGIATDVAARVRGLQGSNPFKVEVYGTRLFPDYSLARLAETALHAEFADLRGFGEWFSVAPERVMVSLRLLDEAALSRPSPKSNPHWTEAERRIAKALTF
jgi:hypothetical protein